MLGDRGHLGDNLGNVPKEVSKGTWGQSHIYNAMSLSPTSPSAISTEGDNLK